jgi:hypothetical protein
VERAIDLLFYVAGIALLSHFALCFLLQHRLRDNLPARRELFATPNEVVGGPSRFKLLRARYYLLWGQGPTSRQTMSSGQIILFNFARTTGLLTIPRQSRGVSRRGAPRRGRFRDG